MMTSVIAIAIAIIQAKYESKILSLYEMTKKLLLLKDFSLAIPPSNPDSTIKAHPSTNALLRALTKRWNQANLSYFDPHFNRAHGEGEIVLVGKDMYYKNVVFFVQCL